VIGWSMSEGRVERRLAAILAADVAGYSRLMSADEEGTVRALLAIRRDVGDLKIAEHRGRIVKTTGDGLLVEFASAVDAVRCAVEVQAAMRERNADISADKRIEFRIGLHQGDIIVEDSDIFGDGVNVAARLEALAEPGGICVSARVQEDTAGRLDLAFDDLGEQNLKNIARPVRAYRVRSDSTVATAAAPALSLPDKPSIAVLPFANMSGDPEQEYFADGIVEEIITALSRIRWLFVIARNSSFTYKGRAVDVKRVGRELGVRYVLEGSVRRGGNRVRVTTQLIDAITGAHVWAERYDRDLSDIFAVQDEITASVAGIIEPALFAAEQERVLRKRPHRLDAWEACQRGMWHFNKYGGEENKIAQDFFRQAIALDPNFAPGHYGLALALFFDFWLYSTRSAGETLETALAEARTAASLDDRDAMARCVLSTLIGGVGQLETSIAEARAALTLNPNSAFGLGNLGAVLRSAGHSREAMDYLRQAIRASPHDPLNWLWTYFIAAAYFQLGEFESALAYGREAIRLRPQHAMAHLRIAASLAYLGRMEEARQAYDYAANQFPDMLARNRTRPPWWQPEHNAQFMEGLRLAAAEAGEFR
jgi:adenylate cyclase